MKNLSFQQLYKKMAAKFGDYHWPKSFAPVPRSSALRDLHGKSFEVQRDVDIDKIPPSVFEILSANDFTHAEMRKMILENKLPCGKRLNKWLGRTLPDHILSSLANSISPPTTITISCDFKDILRMSDTKSFKSCFMNIECLSLLHILSVPSMCIAGSKGSNGDYTFRFIMRCGILKQTIPYRGEIENPAIFVNSYRTYGKRGGVDWDAITEGLRELLPFGYDVCSAHSLKHGDEFLTPVSEKARQKYRFSDDASGNTSFSNGILIIRGEMGF